MRRRKTVPEGIRITRVGLWYVVLTVVLAIPAANTGNNGLYLVVSFLLASLAVSGVVSRQNLRLVDLELLPPLEVYARRPFSLRHTLRSRGRWMDRRLLVLAGVGRGKPILMTRLPRREERSGRLELVIDRRGRHRIPDLHLSSIFPLGLFRKGLRYRQTLELLVYPEILEDREELPERLGRQGESPSGEVGFGHELLSLRAYRPGDDRRGIHWKRSASSGRLVYMERESERTRRFSVVLDNAVGPSRSEREILRFEREVSEAATAAHRYLEEGFEVELLTRGERIPFGTGRQHRRRILESLALVEPLAKIDEPLASPDPQPEWHAPYGRGRKE